MGLHQRPCSAFLAGTKARNLKLGGAVESEPGRPRGVSGLIVKRGQVAVEGRTVRHERGRVKGADWSKR